MRKILGQQIWKEREGKEVGNMEASDKMSSKVHGMKRW